MAQHTITNRPSSPPGHRRRLPYRYWVAVVYVLGLFVEIMDTTIVNVAVPALAAEFGTTPIHTHWAVLGYLLSLALFIPASGWIGDRFGTKRVFLVALALFTVASALCGLAQTLDQLIAFRILQGVGGGMLTPVGGAMLYRAFPQSQRAKAATAVFGVAVLAPAIGPVLGGLLVDTASWRWIFYINIPLGILTVALAATVLVEHREPHARRFDIAGFVLGGAALTTTLYGLSLGPTLGWTSPTIVAALICAPLVAVAFVMVERTRSEPLVHVALFRDPMFRIGNIAGGFLIGGYLGLIFLLPLFLQGPQGQSALHSGLILLPQSVGALVSSQIAGRWWYRHYGPRPLMVYGALLAAASGVAFLAVGVDTDPLVTAALLGLRGLAIGPVFIALQTATYATISPAATGQAVAIYNTQRQVSAAVGIALGAAWLTARTPDKAEGVDPVSAFHESFVLVSILLLVGALISARIKTADARATMDPPPEPPIRTAGDVADPPARLSAREAGDDGAHPPRSST